MFKTGLKDGLPIALGYLGVAFTFGIKAVSDGLTVFQATLVSMMNVTSAGQFAGLPLMLALAPMFEMALTQLVINLRYALMSLSLSQKLDKSMKTLDRMLISFVNTDEVFAVASSKQGLVGRAYLYGLILLPWAGWALGTFLGAAAGSLMPSMLRDALGIAVYGMFLAIILPPLRQLKPVRLVVLCAAGLRVAMTLLPGLKDISSGFAVILCAVIAAALGAVLSPVREAAHE